MAYEIFSKKLTKAIFVAPPNKEKEKSQDYQKLVKQLKSISQNLARVLEVDWLEMQFSDFMLVEPEVIESSLAVNQNSSDGLIMSGSDTYCVFGFTNYLWFARTKLQLKRAFLRDFKMHSSSVFYSYHKYTKSQNTSYELIDRVKVRKLLDTIAPVVHAELSQEITKAIDQECILVLPPISEYTGVEFTSKFMQRVELLAVEGNLKVFIKPHRNDNTPYVDLFSNRGLLLGEELDLRYIPVEFFFSLQNIKYVVSVPSSALALAVGLPTKVLVPKNKNLFRRSFSSKYWS
jgi:hypothetical protein